jgi:signal peptidase I
MKYLRAYGRWIVVIVFLWVYMAVDNMYDLRKTSDEFTVMDPAVKADKYIWIRSIPSMKALKKGRSIVQFYQYIPWGEKREVQNVFLYSRVIALEGETVEIKAGKIYVNGEILDVTHVSEQALSVFDNMAPILVPRGHIYVINDVRTTVTSYLWDSRMLGPVSYELVVGVVD